MTAALKVHGLWVDPYGQENFLALPWLQWLTIEVEVLLGLWLLSGVANRLALFASLSVFTIFAALSFTLAWQGQADCGCFGKVKVNPWYTFGLDIVVVSVLAVTLWRSQSIDDLSKARLSGFLMNCVQVAAITAVLLGLMVAGLTMYAGDPWTGLAKLRGETLTVIPAITQLGEGVAGETRSFTIRLHNYGKTPVIVVGGTTTCSCVATSNLPVTVPPDQSIEINISIVYTGNPGVFRHKCILYRDGSSLPLIAIFTGKVTTNRLAVRQINSRSHHAHGKFLR